MLQRLGIAIEVFLPQPIAAIGIVQRQTQLRAFLGRQFGQGNLRKVRSGTSGNSATVRNLLCSSLSPGRRIIGMKRL